LLFFHLYSFSLVLLSIGSVHPHTLYPLSRHTELVCSRTSKVCLFLAILYAKQRAPRFLSFLFFLISFCFGLGSWFSEQASIFAFGHFYFIVFWFSLISCYFSSMFFSFLGGGRKASSVYWATSCCEDGWLGGGIMANWDGSLSSFDNPGNFSMYNGGKREMVRARQTTCEEWSLEAGCLSHIDKMWTDMLAVLF